MWLLLGHFKHWRRLPGRLCLHCSHPRTIHQDGHNHCFCLFAKCWTLWNVFLKTYIHIYAVPNLRWFDLGVFDFTMVWKRYAYSRKGTWNFAFGFFPRLGTSGMILSCGAGQLPGSQRSQGSTTETPTPIVFVTFRRAVSKLHELVNTLSNRLFLRWFCPMRG